MFCNIVIQCTIRTNPESEINAKPLTFLLILCISWRQERHGAEIRRCKVIVFKVWLIENEVLS